MSFEQKQYGKTTAEDLRIFLEFWPKFKSEYEEAWQSFTEEKELLFGENAISFSWCHLYELPIKQHAVITFEGFLQDENFLNIFQGLVSSENQAAYIPKLVSQVSYYFDDMEPPSKAEALELMPFLAGYLGISLSVFHSLRCVLYHGCFLNELIDRVRDGNDKALFDAIRLDPTVIGCKPVIQRISKAALMQDADFLKKLKAAVNGKIAKREQDHYQKMRLIFEVLYEAQAKRLSDDKLYQLFVEELNFYYWNAKDGGNAKSLRKFADTYMKQNATT